jgi:WD40 repeat protein
MLTSTKGWEGLKLWDMRTQAEIDTPGQDPIRRGPVSCVKWVTRPDELREILCYGTGLGYLIVWVQNQRSGSFVEKTVQRLGTGQEITCIEKDPSIDADVRIVVGMRDKLVLLFSLDSRAQLVNVFAVQLDNTVPKSVAFADNDEDILVFGLYDGNVYVYAPCYWNTR